METIGGSFFSELQPCFRLLRNRILGIEYFKKQYPSIKHV